MHEAVGDRERAAAGVDVKRGLVRREHVHLERDDARREPVARTEALDRRARLRTRAGPPRCSSTGNAELLHEAVAVAVVVAAGEHDPLRPALAERAEAAGRHHRVDQRPGGLDEVGADVEADSLVEGGPVEDAGQDLPHRRGCYSAAREGRPPSGTAKSGMRSPSGPRKAHGAAWPPFPGVMLPVTGPRRSVEITWTPNLRSIVSPPPVWRELRIGLEMRALLRDERFREPPEAPREPRGDADPGIPDRRPVARHARARGSSGRAIAPAGPACGSTWTAPRRRSTGSSECLERFCDRAGRAGLRRRAEPGRHVRARARRAPARPRARDRDARLAAPRAARRAPDRVGARRRTRDARHARSAGRRQPLVRRPAAAAGGSRRTCPAEFPVEGRASSRSTRAATASSTGEPASIPPRARRGRLDALRHVGARRGVRHRLARAPARGSRSSGRRQRPPARVSCLAPRTGGAALRCGIATICD